MLRLKAGERVRIGSDISVSSQQPSGTIKLGIEAPLDVPIVREEVLQTQGEKGEEQKPAR